MISWGVLTKQINTKIPRDEPVLIAKATVSMFTALTTIVFKTASTNKTKT